jgi:peptidyl-tRNA hydrolase
VGARPQPEEAALDLIDAGLRRAVERLPVSKSCANQLSGGIDSSLVQTYLPAGTASVSGAIDIPGFAQERTYALIKPAARMNATGPLLLEIGRRMGFGPADCILVHDDLDIPIRSVRVRTRSGDGGRRGGRSVLQAFRTDEFRRVRVGVGRLNQGQRVEDYVLRPFGAASLGVIDEAATEAADSVLELVGRSERIRGRVAQAGHLPLRRQSEIITDRGSRRNSDPDDERSKRYGL